MDSYAAYRIPTGPYRRPLVSHQMVLLQNPHRPYKSMGFVRCHLDPLYVTNRIHRAQVNRALGCLHAYFLFCMVFDGGKKKLCAFHAVFDVKSLVFFFTNANKTMKYVYEGAPIWKIRLCITSEAHKDTAWVHSRQWVC